MEKNPEKVLAAGPEVMCHEDECVERTPRKIIKNVLVISFGFVLLFSAFQSVTNLQSSINSEAGLGTFTMATIYVALVLSCMFVPTLLIRKLSLKNTLVVSMAMYTFYFAANFYPTWGTLIPASILMGLGGAPLWTSKCAYLTTVANEYAVKTRQKPEDVVTRFFGLFFMIFQTAQIWGNLISYYVLKPASRPSNASVNIASCGISFVTAEADADNENLQRPDDTKLYTLMSILTACAVLAVFSMLLMLDPLAAPARLVSKKPVSLLVETLRHLRKPYQWAILPLTVYSGVQQAFLIADFNQAYVSCALGIHYVGFIMITYGVADAIFSMGFGLITKVIGRVPVFIFGSVVNGAILVVMCTWRPTPDDFYVFFVIAGCWGIGDAVWQTQVNAFYGTVFTDDEEAAFANYRLWESFGFIIGFAIQKVLAIHHKVVVVVVFLVVGMLGYLSIEIHLKFKKKSQLTVTISS
ncbi:hypothetical protein V5799_019478 [Amblyomma americanum]|uniref:Uncharacterized protein n=1 Tax=Amblyomma americanum TaxID=6943 RepID=A0AAQ4EWW2_AMBAM